MKQVSKSSSKSSTSSTSAPKPVKEVKEVSNYDQAVHKLMNKIRKVKSPEANTDQQPAAATAQPAPVVEANTDKEGSSKSEKKQRDKKSSKADKESPAAVKRSNSVVSADVAGSDAVKESDGEPSKKKKHKKSEKSDEAKEKHKKHKKSKKHKKHKSASKERECEVRDDVLITQVPQIAF